MTAMRELTYVSPTPVELVEGTPGRGHTLSSSITLFWLVVAYVLLLRYCYVEIVTPIYAYLGERARPVNGTTFAFAVLGAWVVGLRLATHIHNLKSFVCWVLYILVIIPVMTVPHFLAIASPGQAFALTLTAGASFLVLLVGIDSVKEVQLPAPRTAHFLWTFVWGAWIFGYAYMFLTVDVRFAAISLVNVYDIRMEYREAITASGPLLGYVVRNLGNAINPFLIGVGIYCPGRRWMVIVGLLGQYVIFSFTGYKMVLLSPLAMLAVAVVFRFMKGRGVYLFGAVVGMVLACVTVWALGGGAVYVLIFVYRMVLGSGTLAAAYMAFFSDNEYVKWSDSFLRGWSTSPYSQDLATEIGRYLTGNSALAANSHYIADGFGNWGYAGIAVELLMLILLLWATASAASGLPVPLSCAVLITPTIALANSSPMTAVLSNGFAAGMLIFLLMPRWRY